MSRGRTTKTSVRQRRARNGQTARLTVLARRFGAVGGLTVFALWAGAWIVLNDTPQRASAWAQKQAYAAAGQAGFSVKNILVEGRTYSDPDVLRAIINVQRGDPIFAFDPAEAKELIERVSWVKEAHVERRLPDTIYIGLTERVPVALWQNKKKIRVIDSDGVTMTDRDLAPFKDLIILVGEDAPDHAKELLPLLAAEPDLRERIEAAGWIGGRRWDLTLKNGMTVKLPETGDLSVALRRLVQAQEEDGLLEKDLSVIDMRETDRVIVRTRPGAEKEYKAGAKENSI